MSVTRQSPNQLTSHDHLGDPDSANLPLYGCLTYLVAAAVLGWMFAPTLSKLPPIWNKDPNYSHGLIVPIAALLFLVRIWRRFGPPIATSVSRAEILSGAVRIVDGIVIHLVSALFGALLFDVVALILIAGGVMIAVGGRQQYRRYAFPLWFLLFMVPLPKLWYDAIAINLQQIASAVSAMIFSAFGIPVLREGCYLKVPGFAMEVGAACSGLRQLSAIVALCLVVGHLSHKSRFFKWSLGLASFPIAIAANCIRVTMTGFILMWFGRKWAEGVYHTLEGLAIVAVAAVFILLCAWWLSGWKLSQIDDTAETADETPNEGESAPAPNFKNRSLAVTAVMMACAAASLSFQWHLNSVNTPAPVELEKPLADLPLQLGDWVGEDKPIAERLAYGDQHVSRLYTNRQTRQQLQLWIIYSRHGLDRDHHPEVCMSVAGKKENTAARTTFDVPGHPKPVLQYEFGGVDESQWVFYWHYVLPANTEAGELNELQRFYLKMHYQQSSATLQVFAPASPSEAELQGAREFVRLVDAAIQNHVSHSAIRDNRRKPVIVKRSFDGN